MLEKLVAQLSQELGMQEGIASSENHRYILPFDQDIEVEARELDKSYLLKGIIGSVPQKNEDAFLFKVMEANLFGTGTRDGAIGLNEEGKVLTLSIELDYNSSFKEFKERLEDFTSVIEFWRKEALKHE